MVAWTLRLDPPDDERICVGVTAREYMSVIWADWLLVIDQSEGLGSREYMQTIIDRVCRQVLFGLQEVNPSILNSSQ